VKTSGVRQVCASEASGGLRQLVGTRILAAIEVSESVLQEALHSIREMPPTLRVRVASANRIVLQYRAIHATAVLRESVDLRGPRVELTLQSRLFAWALRRAIRTSAVAGRRVTIDLDRLESLSGLSGVWTHLRSVRFATTDRALFVHVDFAVD
jgi:hypothetical protein